MPKTMPTLMPTSIVRRTNGMYIASYQIHEGQFMFKWTRSLEKALPMHNEFALFIARKVDGKAIPIINGDKKKS